MGNREPMLDWQMVEEGAGWPPPAVLPPQHLSRARRSSRRWRWWALVTLLAILLSALIEGYGEVRRADQAMTRIENEVVTAVVADSWMEQHAAQTGHTSRAGAEHNLETTQALGLEVRRVEVRGDYAMVEVWRNESNMVWMPTPYRWTRFYHETARGWLRVPPPDVFYQPLDTLQMGRFTFVYGVRDADAVLAVAAQVETMDATLRRELGLPATGETITVNIVAKNLPSFDPVDLMRMSDGAMLYVPSPALLPLPASFSEGDALLQLVAGLLLTHALAEALAGAPLTCERQVLVNGLRSWLLAEYSALPSLSRYAAANFLRLRLEHAIPPRLAWLEPAPSGPLAHRTCDNFVNEGVAASLVAYAVSAYGRDRLPALLDGIQRYDSWETLIPAVFGVSAAEFEAGWETYLEASYGGQSSRLSSTVL